jgi:hypothetical protein
MNKFEALRLFMAWSPEAQRLCAEYWIETGEVETTQVSAFGDKLQPVALPKLGDLLPFDQPKAAAKVASTQGRTTIYRGEFGIIEREYLAKCHHETSTRRDAANMFLDQYPGRSVQAVEIKIRKMLDASGVMHVRY